MKITPEDIRKAFGNVAPPACIWERQFDGFDHELARMGSQNWRDIDDEDLWYYFHDLSYMELQPDLFCHLFPVCLNYWFNTLMRDEDVSLGDAEFHYALLHGDILKKIMSHDQREFVLEFFHHGIIHRLESERWTENQTSVGCDWIYRFNSLGVTVPVVERIWESWWNLDHPRKAFCAVMWASGLVYEKDSNPIYGAFSLGQGGGGPHLAENDSMIYDAGWLPENLYFLVATLRTDYVKQKLGQAAEVLKNEPEGQMAAQVADDAQRNGEIISERIDVLFDDLSKTPFGKSDIW